jgi:Ca2+-binding EF-hand superfamily protein
MDRMPSLARFDLPADSQKKKKNKKKKKKKRRSIDIYELREALRAVGQSPTEKELAAMIAEVDQNGNQVIEYAEFLRLVARYKEPTIPREADSDILDAFVAMGGRYDKSGEVSTHKLREYFDSFGLNIDIDRVCFLFFRGHEFVARKKKIEKKKIEKIAHNTQSPKLICLVAPASLSPILTRTSLGSSTLMSLKSFWKRPERKRRGRGRERKIPTDTRAPQSPRESQNQKRKKEKKILYFTFRESR